MELAADQLGADGLVAAAPWFHADHIVQLETTDSNSPGSSNGGGGSSGGGSSGGGAGAAGEKGGRGGGGAGGIDGRCDWCGQLSGRGKAKGSTGSGGGTGEGGGVSGAVQQQGCSDCGCALYCSTKCAEAAAPHHAVNCWKLKQLSRKGAVLRPVADLGRPMFQYV